MSQDRKGVNDMSGLTYEELSDEEKKKHDEDSLIEDLYEYIMTGGRKASSHKIYKPEMCKVLLRHVGIEGKSYASLAFKLGAHVNTLASWEKKHPEWKEAKDLAFNGRLSKLEDMLMDLGTGKTKGNAAAAIFYSKNAAPAHYKDKREIENNYQGTVYVIDTGIGAKKKAVETKGVETKPQLTPPDNNSSDIVEADFTELHQDKDDPEDLL